MRQYEMCVSSHVANLAQVAEFVAERARVAGMDEAAVYDLQMAVDEACTNAMQHAYSGREDGDIRICCFFQEGEFVVSVTDRGVSFDPSSVRVPDITTPLERRDIGGLGLFLMRQLVDSIEFFSPGGAGNQVVMRKRANGGS
jgi:anti-sigma regulatory factor (Ser/Thr protein kinase)